MTPRGGGLLLAGLASFSSIAFAEGATEVLTLKEAVRIALEGNRTTRNAALDVARAEDSLEAAKTYRLPVFDLALLGGRAVTPLRLTVPGGALGDYPLIGEVPPRDTVVEAPRAAVANVTAQLAQPLSQLHKVGLGVRLQEESRDLAKEKLRSARISVRSDVTHLYYALLEARSALSASEAGLLTAREIARIAGKDLEEQVVLRSDSLEALAQEKAQEYKVLSQKDRLQTLKEQMNDLLGRPTEEDFDLEATPSAPPPQEVDLQGSIALALERRPELREARLGVDLADTDRRLKRADVIPDLSLVATYFTFAGTELLPRNVADVGLQLKWQPFDWGRRGREVAEQTLAKEKAENGVKEAGARVTIDVRDRVRRCEEAFLLLEARRLSEEAARERLRVATNKAAEAASLARDVLQAKAVLLQAAADSEQALLGVLAARADLDAAIGEEP